MSAGERHVRVVPADEASWADLQLVLGTRGEASRCQCQRYKLRARESFADFPTEGRMDRLRGEVDPGRPDGQATCGLLAYLGEDPVGWCAVAPRPTYVGALRHSRVWWESREEDKHDATVWSVTCFVTRVGFRRRGIASTLALAAVSHARQHGARAIEAYPITTTDVITMELHVGLVGMFAAAGLEQVSAPTSRRVVMRMEL